MKSTIRKSTYKAIYRLLDRVSPVPFDCGSLCGCACCLPDEDSKDHLEEEGSMGIYLLPGEDKIFSGDEDWLTWNWDDAEDYEFPNSWRGRIPFISCNTPPVCERSMRPIQCRTYPVAPHLMDEQLILILSDMTAPYTCPLIEANSLIVSDPDSISSGIVSSPDGISSEDTFPGFGSIDIPPSHLKLDERFLRATYTVWNRLIKDPLIHDLVKMDSEDRDFFIPIFPYDLTSIFY